MHNYYYTREIVNNAYNIDNPLRVDEGGNQIFLAKEIESSFPNKIFKLFCGNDLVNIVFYDEPLTDDEKIDLDECVYNHKNNL